jgi:PAS domain S-box-containing protein
MDRALVFILVACSSDTLRSQLGAALRPAGFAVLKAATPDEALRQASAPARVAVLQGELVAVARHLREEPSLAAIPLVVIGEPSTPLADRALPGGVAPAEVLRHVRELIDASPLPTPPRPVVALFRDLIEGLTAQVAILDQRGVILAVNEAWRAFARDNGGNPSRLSEGACYLSVCGGDQPEGREFAAGLRRALAGEVPEFVHEYPCHSPEEFRWFVARARRVHVGGAAYVLITHENITDRKRVEEALEQTNQRLSDILESLTDGYAAIDREGRFLFLNKAVERFLGRPRVELAARDLWQAAPELVKAGVRDELARAWARRSPVLLERYFPAGCCWAELYAYPTGEGFLLHLRDVTERVQAREAEARARAERVEQLEREVRHLQQVVAVSRAGAEPGRLRESAPELFRDWVAYYEEILELALEQRSYRVVNQTSERVRSLAERLAFAGASPRDLVELHTQALQARTRHGTPSRAQTYVEEGRLLLVELMGDLASCYRAAARGRTCP